VNDPVLEKMAAELAHALLANGLDPSNPPQGSSPPSSKAFAEYKKRGGDQYADPDEMTKELVRLVKTNT
jgi:hypothetical protein